MTALRLLNLRIGCWTFEGRPRELVARTRTKGIPPTVVIGAAVAIDAPTKVALGMVVNCVVVISGVVIGSVIVATGNVVTI